MIEPEDGLKDVEVEPSELDDLETQEGDEQVQGGKQPTPGGPVPIPYPN